MEMFLLQLFIFLAAAAIAVPVAKKLGLGSVLGYLIAGIVIGPFVVSIIHDVESVMHFTEFGVVMMLFLVGLELKPSLLWQLRVPILGVGGAQVVLSSLALFAVALYFLPWQQAAAVGLVLSLSSTAIVLQTLQERGQMESDAGRSVFSVLLFQDLAVIPMLAGFPLLATLAISMEGHQEHALIDLNELPNYLRIAATLSAVALVFFLGRFASQPMFRAIAATGVREVFVAAALGLVIGTSLLMMAVGLSPALGAFLAGVVLADSEFRHELESDIEPFKGLLLGIFFISIGASLNLDLIANNTWLIVALVVGLIVIKWLVLLVIGFATSMNREANWLFAIALTQGGEFAFVLFQFSKTHGVLPASVIEPLISAVAISMFLAPILFTLYDKVLSGADESSSDTADSRDVIDRSGHRVILAGFGRLGVDIGRFLLSAGIRPVIIDNNSGNVEVLRKLGFEVYYGDITRLDLLESAGASDAELLIVAIGDTPITERLVELATKHYPRLKLVVSAEDREAAFHLMDAGVHNVHRESFGSALSMGQSAMVELGVDPYDTYRMKRIFRKKDQEMMPDLYRMREEESSYISLYQKQHEYLETLMTLDLSNQSDELDRAWTAKNPEV